MIDILNLLTDMKPEDNNDNKDNNNNNIVKNDLNNTRGTLTRIEQQGSYIDSINIEKIKSSSIYDNDFKESIGLKN